MKREVKAVLITGASSGIGRALALEYARRGANVMVAARREAELTALCDEIRAAGGRASAMTLDVADAQAAWDAASKANQELGGLDMVVAHAGVGDARPLLRTNLEDITRQNDVNARGAMATLAGAIPIFAEKKRGQLVGVSSLAGRRALAGGVPYSATKAALSVFLEGARIELGRAGIGVSDVQPGFVDTAMTKKNKFPMPFMWDAPKAARYIADRLEGDPRIVSFPLPLAFLTRLSQFMPHGLFSLLTRNASGRK